MYDYSTDHKKLYRDIKDRATVICRIRMDDTEKRLVECLVNPNLNEAVIFRNGDHMESYGVGSEKDFGILCDKLDLEYIVPNLSPFKKEEDLGMMAFFKKMSWFKS